MTTPEETVKQDSWEYTSLRVFADVTIAGLGIICVLAIVSIWFTLTEITLLQRIADGARVSPYASASIDKWQSAIGILYVMAFVISAITFLIWINRASANLAYMGALGQRYSAGRAMGCWFIPIVNLFRPFQVMAEIAKGSNPKIDPQNLGDWKNSAESRLLRPWWATWLLGVWVERFLMQLVFPGENVENMIAGNWFSAVMAVILVVSAALAIVLVQQIPSNQEKRHVEYQELIERGAISPEDLVAAKE